MALRNITLVYGGATIGLMGAVARAVKEYGGEVIGIIPDRILNLGVGYDMADELMVTPDLRRRKALMERKSDAFLAMPGGFGTVEEILEILTLKQLGYHEKPVIFLNTNGYFDKLNGMLENMYAEKFARVSNRELYAIVPDVPSIFHYLETYEPKPVECKIFKK